MMEATGKVYYEGELNDVFSKAIIFMNCGFYVSKVESYVDWPFFFWKRIYCVSMQCDLVSDGSDWVNLPSTEELIKELS